MIGKIKNWITKNPKEFWILLIILSVSVILRLYKIDQYLTFLGDEGRDVIVVRRLLVEGDPILIGPGTSIGGMYLGPLYYYMMAPALLLANFSPVGPAVQVALLGVLTVFFVWYVTRKWFGNFAAVVASSLYAVSPTVVHFARSSWNPNIMPFFSLLSIYSIWEVWKNKNYIWLPILGISFAFVLQSHYLGLLLAPTLAILWFLEFIRTYKKPDIRKKFLGFSVFALTFFAVLMSPLLFFDIRHNWMNTRALHKFFSVRQETVSARPWSSLPKVPEIFRQIDTSLVGGKNVQAGGLVTGIFVVSFIAFVLSKGRGILKEPPEILMLISWLAFGLIGFGLYKQQIYDHYYGFIFVVPFILLGVVFQRLFKEKGLLKIISLALLIYLFYVNLINNPLKFHPNRQLQRSQNVANKILFEDSDKKFNLAVLAERNYEDGYRYFLEKEGATVLHADPWDKNTITEELYVVCEMPKEKCDPTHSPKAEVANFGMTKIDMQWEIDGVIIYRLLHTQ
jgi:4-amino-4-deoxy-L-arabinose transferase-like glycosyltransferase